MGLYDDDNTRVLSNKIAPLFLNAGVNMHVKSIVRLSDMNLTEAPHVHYPTLPMLNGNQHDTNGNIFRGAFNPSGPTNVAVLHHYMTKSFEEYKDKRVRGRADLPDWSPGNPGFEYKLVVKQATVRLRRSTWQQW